MGVGRTSHIVHNMHFLAENGIGILKGKQIVSLLRSRRVILRKEARRACFCLCIADWKHLQLRCWCCIEGRHDIKMILKKGKTSDWSPKLGMIRGFVHERRGVKGRCRGNAEPRDGGRLLRWRRWTTGKVPPAPLPVPFQQPFAAGAVRTDSMLMSTTPTVAVGEEEAMASGTPVHDTHGNATQIHVLCFLCISMIITVLISKNS